jgi:hypothetical protein
MRWHELDKEDKRLAVVLREKQDALKKKSAKLVREFRPLFKHKITRAEGKKEIKEISGMTSSRQLLKME